jgi:hypothetical protein
VDRQRQLRTVGIHHLGGGLVVCGQAAASWTADEACRRAKEWLSKGSQPHPCENLR